MLDNARRKVFGQCALLESQIFNYCNRLEQNAEAVLDDVAERLLTAGYIDGLAQSFLSDRCGGNLLTFLREVEKLPRMF